MRCVHGTGRRLGRPRLNGARAQVLRERIRLDIDKWRRIAAEAGIKAQ